MARIGVPAAVPCQCHVDAFGRVILLDDQDGKIWCYGYGERFGHDDSEIGLGYDQGHRPEIRNRRKNDGLTYLFKCYLPNEIISIFYR